LLTLCAFLFVFFADQATKETLAEEDHERKTILIAGVDDVGENTEVLLLCSLDKKTSGVSLLQIPRDTYFKTANGGGKINRIFRAYSSKYGRKDAAGRFCDEIAEALGVPLDGYVILSTRTLGEITELLGGVTVDVPAPISYFDPVAGRQRTIPKGVRTLGGQEAVAYVRHRHGYAEGDLGRLDAQMRFLAGAAKALPNLKKRGALLTIYKKILPNLLTNLGEKDIMEVMMVCLKKRSAPELSFMRLPGEACYTNGSWYYVLYRETAERMLQGELSSRADFDAAERFYDGQNERMRNVYRAKGIPYRVYTASEASNKRVLRE
jgi:LCP family protein required for cell wall assembly